MESKIAETRRDIDPLLANRWSPRAINPDRPLSGETLTSLFEAARWAPSCFNQQPWRYLVCNKFTHRESWDQALLTLVPGNSRWASNAPVLIVAFADHDSKLSNGEQTRWAAYDTGAASENICLQASALGLAAHQMGGFDAAKLISLFAVPDGYEPLAVIAVGYAGDANLLQDWQREQEIGPRSRLPLHKIVFSGEWKQSFSESG